MTNPDKSISVTDDTSSGGLARLREIVRGQWGELSPGERAVCQYLISCQPEDILFPTAAELGEATGTSNATVVRTVRRLGYDGLPGLKREIAQEFTTQVAPEDRIRQRVALVGQDAGRLLDTVFSEAGDQVRDCLQALSTESFEKAVTLLTTANTVMCYGVGGSELGARHLARRLGRLGRSARYVGATGFGLADELLGLRHGDTVVLFAPGRILRDLEVIIDHAKAVGAARILVTGRLDSTLAEDADVVLHAPLSPTGSTSEALPAILLVDGLRMAIASLDQTRTVETSHLLTVLRDQILDQRGNNGRRPSRP